MCGNFGLLAASESPSDQKLTAELIKSMGALTELRGALGGGLGWLDWSGNTPIPTEVSSDRIRINPGKRESLSDILRDRFVALNSKASRRSSSSGDSDKMVAIVAHTRYPTSSRSTVPELHPHQWSDHRSAAAAGGSEDCVWFSRADSSLPGHEDDDFDANDDTPPLPLLKAPPPNAASSLVHRAVLMSHNGDFDEYDLFGSRVSYVLVGRWLSRVLHSPDTCVGDSPKIAGMLELLNTKGSWDFAVRLAYQRACCSSVADAAAGDSQLSPEAPNTSPKAEWCVKVGKLFSLLWENFLGSLSSDPKINKKHAVTRIASLDSSMDGSMDGSRSSSGGGSSNLETLPETATLSTTTTPATAVSSSLSSSSLNASPSSSNSNNKRLRMSAVELEAGFVMLAQAQCSELWASEDPVLNAIGGEMQHRFVVATVTAFLHNDIFVAMTEFVTLAHGSFGLQAISATEPRSVAIAAKGQGMRLSVAPEANVALWGSEGTAVEVPLGGGGPGGAFVAGTGARFVLRLDSVKGQVVHLKANRQRQYATTASTGAGGGSRMAQAQQLNIGHASAAAMGDGSGGLPRPRGNHTAEWDSFSLRSFGCEKGVMHTGAELRAMFRPFVPPRPAFGLQVVQGKQGGSNSRKGGGGGGGGGGDPGDDLGDAVLNDIRSIPSVLDLIISKWRDGVFSSNSLNRRSAAAFSEAFFKAVTASTAAAAQATAQAAAASSADVSAAVASTQKHNDLHLLVVGVEVSLWVAEQFAADVMEFVPCANAKAVSANQLVGGDKVYFSARDSKGGLSLAKLAQLNTVVLVVSQSGQTFPSLKATAHLCSVLGDRVFVLVGGREEGAAYTEMGAVVMDHHRAHLNRNGSDHVFCNLSGPRPCEPSSVAVVASHQSLTELLIFTRLAMSRLAGEGDGGGGGTGDDINKKKTEEEEEEKRETGSSSSSNSSSSTFKKSIGFADFVPVSDETSAAAAAVLEAKTPKLTKLLQTAASDLIKRQRDVRAFREAVTSLTAPSLLNIRDIVGCDAHGTLTPAGRLVDLQLGRIDKHGYRKSANGARPRSSSNGSLSVWLTKIKRVAQGLWSAAANNAAGGSGCAAEDMKFPNDFHNHGPSSNSINSAGGNNNSNNAGDMVHGELVAVGRRWGQHFSEPWRVLFLCGAYVGFSVTFHCSMFRVVLNLILILLRAVLPSPDDGLSSASAVLLVEQTSLSHHDGCWSGLGSFIFGSGAKSNDGVDDRCPLLPLAVGTLVSALDAVFYVMMGIHVARFLRWREGRPLMHRFGKRSVVVADTPWVGLCVEAFVSRIFSLAYGFACPEVHSADPVDGLIHQFGQRAVRGLLVAVGRPDGRLFAFTKTESAVLLSTKQMSFVENLGENPEVLTLGSNPHFEPANCFKHVVLPSQSRPKFMDEVVYGQMMQNQKQGAAAAAVEQQEHRRAQLRASGGNGTTTAASSSSSAVPSMGQKAVQVSPSVYLQQMQRALQGSDGSLQSNYGVVGLQTLLDMSAHGGRGGRGGLDGSQNGQPRSFDSGSGNNNHNSAVGMGSGGLSAAMEHGVGDLKASASVAQFSPGEMAAFQANLDPKTERFLNRFSLSQRLLEARFNSLERFVSFTVIFHAAAEATNAGLWGLPGWNYARSQSHMRINTTACPVLDGASVPLTAAVMAGNAPKVVVTAAPPAPPAPAATAQNGHFSPAEEGAAAVIQAAAGGWKLRQKNNRVGVRLPELPPNSTKSFELEEGVELRRKNNRVGVRLPELPPNSAKSFELEV